MLKVHRIKTQDGHNIALWCVQSTDYRDSDSGKNVLLIHGAFSDKQVFMGLADFLANNGFTVWVLEWRSHGDSENSQTAYTFETIASQEIKAAFNYLLNECHIKNIHCITHSGGGICLTIFLIQNIHFKNYIDRIVMLSCQTHGACGTKKDYLRVLIAKLLSKMAGFIPGKRLKLGPHNESYYTMRAWFNWNLNHNFIGENGCDFLSAMKNIDLSILFLSGEGDTIIAPEAGCRQFYEAFENQSNRWLHCAESTGYLEDYGHSRLLLSKNAAIY